MFFEIILPFVYPDINSLSSKTWCFKIPLDELPITKKLVSLKKDKLNS